MKTKRFINGLALAFSAVMTMLFVGCNPEQPENEKEINKWSCACFQCSNDHAVRGL